MCARCLSRSHNRLDGMHNASVRLNSGDPDQNTRCSLSNFVQNLCKVGQRGRRPIKKGDGRRKCRHEQFLVWPAFERTSKPVARSHYHPSILPLPLSPLSSFAHSNMYPSTHALAMLPDSPLSLRPAALPSLPPSPNASGEHNNGNISDATAHAGTSRRHDSRANLPGPESFHPRNLSVDDVRVERQYHFSHCERSFHFFCRDLAFCSNSGPTWASTKDGHRACFDNEGGLPSRLASVAVVGAAGNRLGCSRCNVNDPTQETLH